MGREARRRRIVLSEADCDKWLAQFRLLELAKRDARDRAARLALEMVAKEIAGVEADTRAVFEALGKKYGFDPRKTYDVDPARRTLIEFTGKGPA